LDVRYYRPGEFIFDMGEHAGRVYFLERGIIKITIVSPDGRERILDVVNAGDTFGETFLSIGRRRTAAAQSLTASTVRTMALEVFMSLMQTLPNLCLNFIQHLTELQRRTLVRLDAQMQMDRGLRLLTVLLDLAERCGRRTGDAYTLPGELTQGELACMVGLNRSTVSVLLNYYRRIGILGGQGSTLVIHATPTRALVEGAGLFSPSASHSLEAEL
jgi:CRP-like cAMP-binding protein